MMTDLFKRERVIVSHFTPAEIAVLAAFITLGKAIKTFSELLLS